MPGTKIQEKNTSICEQEFTKLSIARCHFNIQTKIKEDKAPMREMHAIIRSIKMRNMIIC